MKFKKALEILEIPEFEQRIFNSHSKGELMHLQDYMAIASMEDVTWFRGWFLAIVEAAEEEWDRPESVFQHIMAILQAQTKQ